MLLVVGSLLCGWCYLCLFVLIVLCTFYIQVLCVFYFAGYFVCLCYLIWFIVWIDFGFDFLLVVHLCVVFVKFAFGLLELVLCDVLVCLVI